MVYCGIRSRACHSCRSKKTRCDQIPLPDGCTQCTTAKRVCPGYRTPGELVFRDESSSVVRKFKAREAKEKGMSKQYTMLPPIATRDDDLPPQESLEIVRQQPPLQWNQPEHASLELTIMPTIEERATGYFVTNYVLSNYGPTRGHLDYIANLYGTHRVDGCLASSMIAVGLASYAHTARAPSLMDNARRQYVKALQQTNEALRSPKDVKKDSTLVAIMILGIFEVVTGCGLKNWADHIDGATALIKLRGREQLGSIAGRRMLIQVVSSLTPTCIRRGVPLPEHMVELMAETRTLFSKPDPALIVQEVMMRYASLNAMIQNGTWSDPQIIIDKALELDGVLLDAFADLPAGWEYATLCTKVVSDMVYDGRYHIYYDHWIAQSWNAMRVARILVHERVRTELIRGFSSKPPLFSQLEHTAQFQSSTDICYQLQSDILDSVPYHLGFCSTLVISETDLSTAADIPSMPMSSGYFLVWPLWFAAIMDLATEPIRQYVIKNLHYTGVKMGLQQALVLASMIKMKVASP